MIGHVYRNTVGTAAAEFVLALPIMLALLFGTMEAGHFFWTQHKIVKSVRDGVRYASRLEVDRLCDGDADLITAIRNVTATGQAASGGTPKVPGWQPETVDVDIVCDDGTGADGFVDTGIYTDLGDRGPLVEVDSGPVQYPSILARLGFIDDSFSLSAQSNSAVVGI